jgi:hypothetical protein
MVTQFSKLTTVEEYQDFISTAQVGDIASLEHGLEFEDFLEKIDSLKEQNRVFRAHYVPMGHPYHAQYGPNTAIVGSNFIIIE